MLKEYVDLTTKILIADDACGARAALKCQLAKLGLHNVIEAADGDEAFQMLEEERGVKLAILDAQMPGLQGMAMLKRIEGDKRLRRIPLIMAATHGEWEEMAEVTGAKVLGHLPKPVIFEELVEHLGAAFSERKDPALDS